MTGRERYFARRERWRRAKKWRRHGEMIARMEDGRISYLVYAKFYARRTFRRCVHENSH